jgi:hypothetical protein
MSIKCGTATLHLPERLRRLRIPKSAMRSRSRSCFLAITLLLAAAHRGYAQKATAYTLTEEARIDGNAQTLVPINSLRVRRDGSVAILQPQDHRVLIYDSIGRKVASFGREGEGPGEFRATTHAAWMADSLWIYDFQLRRITVLDPSGGPNRSVSIAGGAKPAAADIRKYPSFVQVSPVAFYSDGTILLKAIVPLTGSQIPGYPPGGTAYVRTKAADGLIRQVLRVEPADQGAIQFSTSDGQARANVPFFPRPFTEIAPDGSRLITVTTVTWGADAERIRIRAISSGGRQIYSVTRPFRTDRVTRQAADSALNVSSTLAKNPAMRARVKSLIPGRYPLLRSAFVDSDGRAWLELRAINATREWWVIGATGQFLGTVTVPLNVALKAAKGDRVWGLETDTDDVQSVVRYRMK